MKATQKQLEQRRKYHKEHKEEENIKARLNYQKNKNARIKASREYYITHKEQQLKKAREYKEKNKELIKQQNRILYYNNHDYNLKSIREHHIKNPIDKTKKQRNSLEYNKYMKEYLKIYNQKNKEKLKKYKQLWSEKNKTRLLAKKKLYYKENKQSFTEKSKLWYQKNKFRIAIKNREEGKSGKRISLELEFAMNRVRKRDNNTCQWYGCGLKHRVTEVHVHHIFPRSEYPELELVEQYMICYCAEHHAQFHASRGDYYHKLIKNQRKLIANADHKCNIFEEIKESD